MKTLFLPIAFFIVLTSSCKKNESDFEYYFYTGSNDRELNLYVDGNYKGQLPYISYTTHQVFDSLRHKALFIVLPSGKHAVSAKDKEGNVVSDARFKVCNSGGLNSSLKGTNGEQETVVSGNVVVFSLK